jgi:hypothetical protein
MCKASAACIDMTALRARMQELVVENEMLRALLARHGIAIPQFKNVVSLHAPKTAPEYFGA